MGQIRRFGGYFKLVLYFSGALDGIIVKVLCYELDGLGIDYRWCHWIF